MKPMNPASMRALFWLATFVLGLGFLIPSPSGAFLAFVLAALLAAFPAIFGAGKVRLAAAVLLTCCLYSATVKYPEFRSEQEHYRQRAKAVRLTATHAADSAATARS